MLRNFSRLVMILGAALLAGAPSLHAQTGAPLRGDVDGDGRVTAADARIVSDFLVGRPVPAGAKVAERGDVNGDGRVTSVDAAIIAAAAAGRNVSRFPVGTPVAEIPGALNTITCYADVVARSVRCGDPRQLTPGGPRGLISSDTNGVDVRITTTPPVFTEADSSFVFDATVQNLIPQTMGTTDGVTPDPKGVQVFFDRMPVPTGPGNDGNITIVGDGTDVFPNGEGPFYQYPMLAPGQTSPSHSWRFEMHGTVVNFIFRVKIQTVVRYPDGWVDIYPPDNHLSSPDSVYSLTVPMGETRQLSDSVRLWTGRDTVMGVNWTSTGHGAATVDASGLVTAAGPGVDSIIATAGPRLGRVEIRVTAPSADSTTIDATPPEVTVGDTSLITVQVRDNFGNNVTTGGATVVLQTTVGTIAVTDTATDNGNGTYTAKVTSDSAGTATITGTLNGATIGDDATVTFSVGTPANMVKSAGDGQTAVAGSAVAIAPAVTVTDAGGHPVPGVEVTFTVTGGGGSVTGSPVTTNASGVATVGSWTLGTTAGANTLDASATGLTTVTFTATGTAGAAVNMVKSAGDGQTATAGSAVAVAPAVTVTDANNNPVAGVSVTFAPASGGGSVTGSPAVTDASGVATVGSWTLGTTAGANTLDASATGLTTVTFTATGTVGPAANMVKSAGDAQTATAGSAVATAPAVTVTDANNNPVAGVSVTFTVTGGGGSVAGSPAVTNASGVATAGSWTLGNTAGANTLDASATGLTTVTFTATGVAGPPAIITKVPGTDGQSAIVNQNVANAPAVTITDVHNNPVAGVSVTFTPASGGGSVTGGTTSTNASGVATVGSWKLGTTVGANTLSAVAGALNTTFSATATPDVPANIAKTAGDLQNGTVGAAVATAPAVHVTDQFGNATPGVTVTFAIVGGGGSRTVPTPTTDGSGNAAVGSWTLGGTAPGPNQLSATATGGSSPTTTFTAYVPPVVLTDSSQAMGNTTLGSNVAPNVLGNDVGLNGTPLAISTTGALATVRGGTLTLAADGTFSYLPPAGNVLRDSVQYTVGDTHLTASAYVKIRFVGKVWYVENTFGGTATGRDVSPFTSVANAEAVAGVNDSILVRTGSGTTGGGTLKSGQTLRGQGHNAAFTTTLNGQAVTLLPTGGAPNVGALVLGSGNSLRGLRVFNAAGGGISGTSVGTLSLGELSVGVTGGSALDLSSGTVTGNGGVGAAVLDSVRSTNSSAGGIALSGISGTLTVNGGTASAIVNPTGAAVSITGSGPTFTFPGPISKTNGSGTGISLTTTSATVSFTGPSIVLSTGTSTAINLSSASGTVSFVDSVKINTTSGTGISASNGGTLTIAGTHNSISSGSGTALSVTNATIGAGGLNFRSISANGGSNGIVLTNTGATAGLTVTGDGSTAASGGTIQNLTGADGGVAGNGVYLNNTRNASLAYMSIHDVGGNGLYGTSLVNLTLNRVRFTGANGDNLAGGFTESAVKLDEVTGSASITGSFFSGGMSNNLRLSNTSGSLNRITLTSDTFAVQPGNPSTRLLNDALLIQGLGTATVNATIQASTFQAAGGDLFQYDLGGNATGDLVLNGTAFSNNHSNVASGGGGVVVSAGGGGTATMTYAITNNTFRDALGTALVVSKTSGTGTATGSITGNSIGVAGVGNSGSAQGSGMDIGQVGGGRHTTTITGNTIRQFTNLAGILFQVGNNSVANGGQGRLKATVQSNLIAEVSPAAASASIVTNGIHIQTGTNSGDNLIACMTVGGAGGLANTVNGTGTNGGTDIRLRALQSTQLILPGFVGNATVATERNSFVQGNNAVAPTVSSVTGGSGTYAGGSCPF